MNAAERRFTAFVRGRIPLAQVRARADADVPVEPGIGVAVQGNTTFAPRARDDRRLDEIALNAVIVGRLVMLVEQAERHEHQAGAHAVARRQRVLDIQLLDFRLALIVG